MRVVQADLTGRARLRDAAIEAFAAQGFQESLRSIAARAGVSAGLVRHHFGSKDALRAECDATVLERYRRLKLESLRTSPAQVFAAFPAAKGSGILLVYILRSVREGGTAGREFIEALVAESLVATREAVERGLIVPSRDEEARIRLLVYQTVGALLVRLTMQPDTALDEFEAVMEQFYADTMLPTLELFTEGFLTDTSYLQQFLAYDATHHLSAGHANEASQR